MAGSSSSFHYQAYEIYLKKAGECEAGGQKEKARKLYLNACEALLHVAQSNSGEVRRAQLNHADSLMKKANSLITGDSKSPASKEKHGDSKSLRPTEDQKEDGLKIYTPASVPNVSFYDIAGLENVKKEVRERIIQPMKNPELYLKFRIRPGGGILMFGLPGTGKTMIARAIAHEVQAPFFHVRCSDIKEKWLGASENNIKKLFETAKEEKSAVLFFDEFDGLGSSADDSSGSMKGILAELKSQMDGFDKDDGTAVLLLAATNHPWDIEAAFLRSGRFSKMIYIPLPDEDTREYLIRRQFDGVPVDQDISAKWMAGLAEGFSGADIVEFCYQCKIMAANRSNDRNDICNVSEEDIKNVSSGFRTTVLKSDVDAMKRFMLKNNFSIPEFM
jgi:SpoVK/Ycf46/Vps4 family AAA+-type ATPase